MAKAGGGSGEAASASSAEQETMADAKMFDAWLREFTSGVRGGSNFGEGGGANKRQREEEEEEEEEQEEWG